jgi:mannobiose 2-epimerase
LLDRNGTPLEDGTKHGHGSSYAISACVYCYELTADLACLELAKAAFAWLDEHAHDNVHGGYFVYYQRDGCPILANDQAGINGKLRDAIGTPIGCKDANTTSDLLKAFSDLYLVWPDALLKQRLQELLRIVRDRLVVAPGLMHMYRLPDWTPLPDFVRYGQVVRSASHRLADRLGRAKVFEKAPGKDCCLPASSKPMQHAAERDPLRLIRGIEPTDSAVQTRLNNGALLLLRG